MDCNVFKHKESNVLWIALFVSAQWMYVTQAATGTPPPKAVIPVAFRVPKPSVNLMGRSQIKVTDNFSLQSLIKDVSDWLFYYYQLSLKSDQDQKTKLLLLADAVRNNKWVEEKEIAYSQEVKQTRLNREKEIQDCLRNDPGQQCRDQLSKCTTLHGIKLTTEERLQMVILSKLDALVQEANPWLANPHQGTPETFHPSVNKLLLWWYRLAQWFDLMTLINNTIAQNNCPTI